MDLNGCVFFVQISICFSTLYAISPLGVPPTKAVLYQPDKDFTCFDGSLTVPFDHVNDDYCDCPDGTDEPGTSACNNGSFYCQNVGYNSEYIPSSRVNDGICDCCDGSDEYIIHRCKDICDILGAEALAEAERQAELINQGNALRLQMSSSGKQLRLQRQNRMSELEKERSEAEKLKNEAEQLKMSAEANENAALEVYRELEEKEKNAEAEREKENDVQEAQEAFQMMDTNDDSKLQETELITKIQSVNPDPDRTDSSVKDEVKFFMKSKTELTWEEFYESWPRIKPIFMEDNQALPPEEDLADEKGETMGDVQEVGDDLEKKDEVEEENAPDEEEFDNTNVPGGKMDSPLKYDEDTQKLIDEATKARNHYEEMERTLKDIDRELSRVKEFFEKDYGQEDEFAPLEGQCFSLTDREYTYKVCPFDQVIQSGKHGGSETRLGTWSGWVVSGDYSAMLYDRGQSCWNGPQRSATVLVSCGLENEVFGAAEPNKCEYVIDFKTPAACKIQTSKEDVHDEL